MSGTAWPWCELELAPTRDAIAIKKAYAALLKKSRPDDDPLAYQKLRAAYDAALDHAREVPSFAPRGVLVARPRVEFGESADAIPKRSFATELQQLPETSSNRREGPETDAGAVVARGLLDEFLKNRRVDSNQVAKASAELRAALDLLSLHERDTYSRPLAQLVVDGSELPPGLMLDLAQYFRWIEDYRQANLLGVALIQELRLALERHRGLRTEAGSVRDVVSAAYRHDDDVGRATLFAALLDGGKRNSAFFFASLASPRLSTLWYQFQGGARALYGASPSTLALGRKVLDWAYFPRATLVLTVVLLVFWAHDGFGWAEVLLSVPVAALFSIPALAAVRIYEVAIQLLSGVADRMKLFLKLPPKLLDRQAWIVGALAALSLTMVMAAAAAAHETVETTSWLEIATRILAAVVLLALLVTRAPWAVVLPGIVVAGAVDFAHLAKSPLSSDYPWLVGVTLAAASQALVERRPAITYAFYASPFRTVCNALSAISINQWIIGFVAVALFLVAAPFLVAPALALALARMESQFVALAAVLIALGVHRLVEYLPVLFVLLVMVFALRAALRLLDYLALAFARRVIKADLSGQPN